MYQCCNTLVCFLLVFSHRLPFLLYNSYLFTTDWNSGCWKLVLKRNLLSCYLMQKYRMEVGTQAMDHLINILQTDRYVDVLLVFFFSWISLPLAINPYPLSRSLVPLLLPVYWTGLTQKSLATLWTHSTTSSATMKRKSKVLSSDTVRKIKMNWN